MERELAVMVGMVGFYAMLIIGVVTLAAKSRSLVARGHVKIGVLETFGSLHRPPPIDVLRVGDGAIVTVRGDIGENAARDARKVVGDLIEDGVVRFILEVGGSASISAPLFALLTEVAEASAVARVHLSLVISNGEAATTVRGSALGERIPIFLTTDTHPARDRH
jgi:hypothetical protein